MELGENKSKKLDEQQERLAEGTEYSLNIINKMNEVNLNGNLVRKKNNKKIVYELNSDDEQYDEILGSDSTNFSDKPNIIIELIYSHDIDEMMQMKKLPSYYKFFPIGDQKNGQAYFVHSNAFEISPSRRNLSGDNRNVVIFETLLSKLKNTMNGFKSNGEDFLALYNSFLLSDLTNEKLNKELSKHFGEHLLDFLHEIVPTLDGDYSKSIEVVIKDTRLPINLKNKKWFILDNSNKNKRIIKEAKEKLNLKLWNISHILENKQISKNDIIEFSDENYKIYVSELDMHLKELHNLENDIYIKTTQNAFYSLKEFKENPRLVLNNGFLDEHDIRILSEINIEVSNVFFRNDSYNKLKILFLDNDYFKKNSKLVDFIENTVDIKIMNINSKIELFRLIDKLCPNRAIKIPFFYDNLGNFKAISNILSYKMEDNCFLIPFRLKKEELEVILKHPYGVKILSSQIQANKVYKNIIFDNWETISEFKDVNFEDIYSLLEKYFDKADDDDKNFKLGIEHKVVCYNFKLEKKDSFILNNILNSLDLEEKQIIEDVQKKKIPSPNIMMKVLNCPAISLKESDLSRIKFYKKKYSLKEIKVFFSLVKKLELKFEFSVYKENNLYSISLEKQQIKLKDESIYDLCNELKEEYLLLPKELYEFNNNDFDDDKIIGECIKSTSFGDIRFLLIDFIIESKLDYILEFFKKEDNIRFKTSEEYTENSYEVKFINLFIILKERKKYENFDRLRKKIWINDLRLDRDVFNEFIKFESLNRTLRLDSIISMANSSYAEDINTINNNLLKLDISNKNDLENIFQLKSKDKDEIIKELQNKDIIRNINEYKFLLFYSLEKKEDFIRSFKFKICNSDDFTYRRILEVIAEEKLDPEEIGKIIAINSLIPILNQSYYILDDNYALVFERLPKDYLKEENYIHTLTELGLKINKNLELVRKNIENSQKINHKFSNKELVNTLNYLSKKNIKISLESDNNNDYLNFFHILKQVSNVENLDILPIMSDTFSFSLRCVYPNNKIFYITRNELGEKNEFFKKRIAETIETKLVVYKDILSIVSVPITWSALVVSSEENEKYKLLKMEKQRELNNFEISNNDDIGDFEKKWKIGWNGESIVYQKLMEKYGAVNITWNNENATCSAEDSGTVDMILYKNNIEYNIEVKSTVGTISRNQELKYHISGHQFEFYSNNNCLNKKNVLVLVSGVGSISPKIVSFLSDGTFL